MDAYFYLVTETMQASQALHLVYGSQGYDHVQPPAGTAGKKDAGEAF